MHDWIHELLKLNFKKSQHFMDLICIVLQGFQVLRLFPGAFCANWLKTGIGVGTEIFFGYGDHWIEQIMKTVPSMCFPQWWGSHFDFYNVGLPCN